MLLSPFKNIRYPIAKSLTICTIYFIIINGIDKHIKRDCRGRKIDWHWFQDGKKTLDAVLRIMSNFIIMGNILLKKLIPTDLKISQEVLGWQESGAQYQMPKVYLKVLFWTYLGVCDDERMSEIMNNQVVDTNCVQNRFWIRVWGKIQIQKRLQNGFLRSPGCLRENRIQSHFSGKKLVLIELSPQTI